MGGEIKCKKRKLLDVVRKTFTKAPPEKALTAI